MNDCFMKPLINIFKKLDFYQTFYGSYFSKSFFQEKINAIWLFSLLGTFLFYPDTIYPRIKMQLKGKKSAIQGSHTVCPKL